MRPNSRPEDSVGRRTRTLLAALLTVTSVLVLVGFLWQEALGRVGQGLLVAGVPVLLILLSSSGALTRLLLATMTILWLLLGGSWVVLIWLDGSGVRTLGGIPLVLWILVLGLGILPLCLVSWVHAVSFSKRNRAPVESGDVAAPPSPPDGGES
jgi:hypothetical protein